MTVKLMFPFLLKSIQFIASIHVPSLSSSLQWRDYTENMVKWKWTCIFEVPFKSPDSLTLKAFTRSHTHTYIVWVETPSEDTCTWSSTFRCNLGFCILPKDSSPRCPNAGHLNKAFLNPETCWLGIRHRYPVWQWNMFSVKGTVLGCVCEWRRKARWITGKCLTLKAHSGSFLWLDTALL